MHQQNPNKGSLSRLGGGRLGEGWGEGPGGAAARFGYFSAVYTGRMSTGTSFKRAIASRIACGDLP